MSEKSLSRVAKIKSVIIPIDTPEAPVGVETPRDGDAPLHDASRESPARCNRHARARVKHKHTERIVRSRIDSFGRVARVIKICVTTPRRVSRRLASEDRWHSSDAVDGRVCTRRTIKIE